MLLRHMFITTKNFRNVTGILNFFESNTSIRMQNYGRFAPRNPVAIVNEDELFDVDTKNTYSKPPKAIKKNRKTIEVSNKHEENEDFSNILDSDELYEYQPPEQKTFKDKGLKSKPSQLKEKSISTKLYENENLVSSLIMDVRSKKRRKKTEQILLEGKRSIRDALEAGLVPKFIVYSRLSDVQEFINSEKQIKFYKVPYRSIQLWSTLTTSPGIMGMFEKPMPVKIKKSSLPLTIICDNVRDPGNMGSILRAAAGVGCEKVILTKGCVDFWDVKVVRSAAGAHFRVPILGSLEWEDINLKLHSDAQVFVADNNAHNFLEENETNVTKEEPKKTLRQEEKEKKIRDAQLQSLPVVPYYAVDYTKNQVILIIGGETEGLSSESFSLVKNKQGVRVNIPLENKVDSLNAGVALGIVAFEVKRQFLLIEQKLNQLAQ